MLKTYKNEPCSCGSGKQYKECCIGSNNASTHDNLIAHEEEKFMREIQNKNTKTLLKRETNEVKMSEIILELASEALAEDETSEDKETTIHSAILAWNISLLPEEKQEKHLDNAVETSLSTEAQQKHKDIFREFLKSLIQRKRELFPNIERLIRDFTIRHVAGEPRLIVSSSE